MWIQTYGGGVFDYSKPEAVKLTLNVLLHPLSHIPRFLGHTVRFYSVAQHSVHVSQIIEDPYESLCGLFHDAHEAFIGDTPRPFHAAFPESQKIENRIRAAVRNALHIDEVMPASVEEADKVLLVNEAHQLLDHPPVNNWTEIYEVQTYVGIPEWSVEQVRNEFKAQLALLLRQLPRNYDHLSTWQC